MLQAVSPLECRLSEGLVTLPVRWRSPSLYREPLAVLPLEQVTLLLFVVYVEPISPDLIIETSVLVYGL
jgi:hypothetical protein